MKNTCFFRNFILFLRDYINFFMSETTTNTTEQAVAQANNAPAEAKTADKKDKKKDAKKQPNKIAFLSDLTIDEFFELCLTTKSITDDELKKFIEGNYQYNNLLEIMDGFNEIDENIEKQVLINVFHKKLGYELLSDDKYTIPAIIKGRFDEKNPTEDAIFKRANAAAILTLPLVVIDIVDDTLVVLMRTPNIPKSFEEKLMPLLKAHKLKKIKIMLTTKSYFNYYKENLTYTVINNVL